MFHPRRRGYTVLPLPLSRALTRLHLHLSSLMLQTEEEEKKKADSIERSLKQSGINKQNAQRVLAAWKKAVGTEGDITPEMLRKVWESGTAGQPACMVCSWPHASRLAAPLCRC